MDGLDRLMAANAIEQGCWTLGRLIDALETVLRSAEDGEGLQEVRYDFCYRVPTTLRSYRGVYAFLALGHTDEGDCTVQELVERLRAANGQTFEGYKGGHYTMSLNTPIFVDNSGDASGTAIVGVENERYRAVIRTRYIKIS